MKWYCGIHKAILFFGILLSHLVHGQSTSLIIEPGIDLIDGTVTPYNSIHGGDTLLFRAGNHDYLLLRNLSGEPGNPIVLINFSGTVIIDTDHHFGISIENCRYFHLTGTGFREEHYGFRIERVQNGGGIGVGNMSTDFEIDHIYIADVPIGGIYAKTDPNCSFTNTREKFTQRNTSIHDNYITRAGNEGMYIGNTKFFGQVVNCNGTDTLLMPSLLEGVYVYNNIINNTGWDGLQISSASKDCHIFDNLIMFDSQSEKFGQMSGIILGGGSKCDCYNNRISDGKGNGIESHGLGSYRIFNNVIVNAGKSFKPLDTLQMKYGIYLTDISALPDSSFNILFNDIINPKSDGIRFISLLSRNNHIVSNAIINPGNYDYYENGHFNFKGIDSYIMIPDSNADVVISNNYFARTSEEAGFYGASYSLAPGSVLIDAAYPENMNIDFDFYHHPRPYNGLFDIGAFEFDPAYLNIPPKIELPGQVPGPSPNPVKDYFNLDYQTNGPEIVQFWIFDLQGNTKLRLEKFCDVSGTHKLTLNMATLPGGTYLYKMQIGSDVLIGRFLKSPSNVY